MKIEHCVRKLNKKKDVSSEDKLIRVLDEKLKNPVNRFDCFIEIENNLIDFTSLKFTEGYKELKELENISTKLLIINQNKKLLGNLLPEDFVGILNILSAITSKIDLAFLKRNTYLFYELLNLNLSSYKSVIINTIAKVEYYINWDNYSFTELLESLKNHLILIQNDLNFDLINLRAVLESIYTDFKLQDCIDIPNKIIGTDFQSKIDSIKFKLQI